MAASSRAATDSTCASVADSSRRVYRGENVLQSTAKRQTDAQAPVVNGASPWTKKLPWIDGFAALSAGALMFVFRGLLSDFYGLPYQLVTTIALVNILYSVFGLTLGLLRRRPAWLLTALISANLVWAAACIVAPRSAILAPRQARRARSEHLLQSRSPAPSASASELRCAAVLP